MLKLNRRTEYALLALRFLSTPGRGVASVHAVAEHYAIPEPLLAKVLQRLKRGGLASAHKGATGGYTLARRLDEVPLMEVMALFDEATHLVDCLKETGGCECHLLPACEIREGMSALHELLNAQLRSVSVATFFAGAV